MKIGVFPFGCKVNQYDLAEVVAFLRGAGVRVAYQEPGDINIVAGCVVTANAEREGVKLIKRLHRAGLKVLLMGCLAVHRGRELKENGFVEDYFLTTNADIERLKSHLTDLLGLEILPEVDVVVELPEHSRAFLKVQDGCTYSCSFCLSRLMRLSIWSASEDDVVSEALALVRRGYREIVITGINLMLYGGGNARKLGDLLLRLADRVYRQGARIRISSLYPSADLWELRDIWHHPALVHHAHLSVQSGSGKVLVSMNRSNYLPFLEEYLPFLRELDPLFGLTGDFIVGYPTEGEDDFSKTVDFVRKYMFHKLHVFPFSPRPGTDAYLLKPLPKEIIKRRGRVLRQIGEELQIRFFEAMDGTIREALYLSDGRVLFDNYVYMLWEAEPFQELRLLRFDKKSAILMR